MTNEKIVSILRSLFRLSSFKEMLTPEIIIETEQKILQKRLLNLTPDELLIIVSIWPEYLKTQSIQSEIDDKLMFDQIEKEIKALN